MNHVDRAVILAAGVGSRLKWLTGDMPKALLPIHGVPMIVHTIRHLAAQGIRDIAVNIHHHAAKLRDTLGDGRCFGVRLYFSCEDTLLDSGGGVRTALDLLPAGHLLAVHNADVMTRMDMQNLAVRVPKRGACFAMVQNPAHHPQGDFSMDDGMLVQTGQSSYTFSGVSIFDAAVFDAYKADTSFSLKTMIDQLMVQEKAAGYLYSGAWLDAGRPRDLILARRRNSNAQ